MSCVKANLSYRTKLDNIYFYGYGYIV